MCRWCSGYGNGLFFGKHAKNCGKAPCFMAKSTINGQFSIVTSNCRRDPEGISFGRQCISSTLCDLFSDRVCAASHVCLPAGWVYWKRLKRPHPKFFLKLTFRNKRNHGPKHMSLRDSHECSMDVPWISRKFPPEMLAVQIYGARHREIARSMVWDLRMAADSAMERWKRQFPWFENHAERVNYRIL